VYQGGGDGSVNDEKRCPLTKMTCYGKECAWWYFGECAMVSLINHAQNVADELYYIRKDREAKSY
jgi:hypothetical protein